jgi:hypothetical protein
MSREQASTKELRQSKEHFSSPAALLDETAQWLQKAARVSVPVATFITMGAADFEDGGNRTRCWRLDNNDNHRITVNPDIGNARGIRASGVDPFERYLDTIEVFCPPSRYPHYRSHSRPPHPFRLSSFSRDQFIKPLAKSSSRRSVRTRPEPHPLRTALQSPPRLLRTPGKRALLRPAGLSRPPSQLV